MLFVVSSGPHTLSRNSVNYTFVFKPTKETMNTKYELQLGIRIDLFRLEEMVGLIEKRLLESDTSDGLALNHLPGAPRSCPTAVYGWT